MKIIIGLGNPGKNYIGTKHNVGFEVIDRICSKYNINITKIKDVRQLNLASFFYAFSLNFHAFNQTHFTHRFIRDQRRNQAYSEDYSEHNNQLYNWKTVYSVSRLLTEHFV